VGFEFACLEPSAFASSSFLVELRSRKKVHNENRNETGGQERKKDIQGWLVVVCWVCCKEEVMEGLVLIRY
jgi:hypothetical protein